MSFDEMLQEGLSAARAVTSEVDVHIAALSLRIHQLTEERDAARGIATELEQRLAAIVALCDAQQAWADEQPWARVLLPVEKVRAAAGGVL